MILNLIVIASVLLIAYLWASRGFFSAFIHLLCTIVAGAIAFAAWEPLAYGVLLGVRDDIAWAVALVAPFVVSLALLRLLVDTLLKHNVQFDDATNFVGGGLCGAASGVLAVGILVIGIGYLRLPHNFLGYAPAKYAEGDRALVRGASLWLPADRLTESFYAMTSEGALATSTPLAQRAPDLAAQGGLLRYTFEDAGRTSLRPADFALLGLYEVTASDVSSLLTDTFSRDPQGNTFSQQTLDFDGNPYPAGSTLVGAVVRFESGAKEKKGQVVIGPGQVRVIAVSPQTGEARTLLPVAFINQADPLALDFKRWRFDSGGVYAASVGGAATTTMAFEFVVPPGFEAREMQVRNVRVDLASVPQDRRPSGNQSLAFASAEARDNALRDFSLMRTAGVSIEAAPLERDVDSSMVRVDEGRDSIIRVADTLPFGGSFSRTNRGGINVDDQNRIFAGEHQMSREMYQDVGLQQNLRIDRFQSTTDTRLVQVEVSQQSALSLLGRAFQKAEGVVPPVLVDSLGRQYQPIGYVFHDGNSVRVRFEPGQPIRGLSQIPNLSASRPDQRLVLIFRVNKGAELRSFAIGNRVVADFDPPVSVTR